MGPFSRAAVASSLAAVVCVPAAAGDVHVAVASNFASTLEEIGRNFEDDTGHRLVISAGSTGKLYAQIVNAAPFDLFLAADEKRPARLEADGIAVPGTRFPYALGRLVLWRPGEAAGPIGAGTLRSEEFRFLAIANPDTAPYGAAAREVLVGLGLWDRLSSRIVRGENVGQAYQFVSTGNAELGLIALSQLRSGGACSRGSRWLVPAELHSPIEQHAVLLRHGRDNRAAGAFLVYLRDPSVRAVLERSGYGIP